jgi:phasin family protein
MSTTHQGKSGGKSRQRNRKPDQPGRKPEQQPPSPMLDQPDEDHINAMAASVVASTDDPVMDIPTTNLPVTEFPAASLSVADAAMPADDHPIGLQLIAKAYENYTRQSLQESLSFVEKLMAVRSFDKAIEVQTEFAKQACENFVAESRKISELYRELAKQMFTPLSFPWGFTAGMNEASRASWSGVASQSKH